MTEPRFKIGDTVFVATADAHRQTQVPCPVCFGKRAVTVILGNGEHVECECEMCGLGYEGPRGTVMEYVVGSSIEVGIVRGISQRGDGWSYSVWLRGYEHSFEDGREWDGSNFLFASREEAEPKRAELHAAAEERAKRNFEAQFKMKTKHTTWSVGYHRRNIAELRRKIEWHESKLRAPKIAAAVAAAEREGA